MLTREEHGKVRAGRISGSVAQRIMTSSRQAWNTIARDLRDPRPFYSVDDTPNMPPPLAWGQSHESAAAGQFWFKHPEYDVLDPRFIYWHNPSDLVRLRHLGFSPDRLLSRAGFDTPIAGLEIKCPYDGEEHVATIRSRSLPEKYKWQIYHGMYVSDLPCWWFVSFDPRVQDESWRYHELLVEPNERDMKRLHDTITEFMEGFIANERFSPRTATAQDFDTWF